MSNFMIKFSKTVLSFAFFLIVSFYICILLDYDKNEAFAETSVKATSGWTLTGTCEWFLDTESHTMTIRPASNGASGALEYSEPWKNSNALIDRIVFQGKIKISHPSFMFSNKRILEISGLGNLDTSDISSMDYMFYDCPSLEKIDLKGFNTENVVSMESMFSGCSALESLDLTSFDTSNVTNMSTMFWDCRALRSLNLSKFDTSRTLNMSGMFNDCASLRSLNLSNFNTSRTTNMSSMFSGCSSLESLNISNFDTTRVSSGSLGFYKCDSLSSITVGSKFTLQSELPNGVWKDARGYSYNNTIPMGVPGTFTYHGSVPSVSISASSKTIKLSGSQIALTAKANSNNWWGSIKWTSSNPLVASVDSYGIVTPQGIGATTIIATADRATATCRVTVVPDNASAGSLVQSKKSFTLKWQKPSAKSLKQITGYKIRYSTSKTMKNSKTKMVKVSSAAGKKCSLKITKLKAKKRYYVQIATYKKIGNKTYQSAWSKTKSVKTK